MRSCWSGPGPTPMPPCGAPSRSRAWVERGRPPRSTAKFWPFDPTRCARGSTSATRRRGGGAATLFAGEREPAALVTWAAVSTLDDDTAWERYQWRKRGVQETRNLRTGEILPRYLDELEDFEANRERLDILRAAGRIRAPWLIVHGKKDEGVSVTHARRLARAAAPGVAELMVLSHATHTFGAKHPFAGPTQELDAALDATTAFLAWHVL